MGRLFDKWMGTKYPDGGVEPLPVLEVRGALLALGGPDARFRVRNALPGERADLVAECRVPEVCLTLKTRMLFVPSKREVRALNEQWEERSQEHSRGQYGRGPATMVYKKWEFRRGADGRRHRVETFRFDTRDVKNPLRDTVLAAGWTWRGVLRKL
ncbi:hypothetical protein ACFWJQ_19495 [Streptomyces goshikiensis]|uniref:hypothetical protein n=1 Tax=Streptomyces goshikiensis TaxID=1942 RepID=UPI00364E1C6D